MRQAFLRHGWLLFACIAALTLASTIAIEALNFSPVPISDMWDGYITFGTRLSLGDTSAWFAQHNEHRIILARLLFWLDMHLFNGSTHFLILCNFLLAFLAAGTFAAVTRAGLPGGESASLRRCIYAAIAILCFSWVQHENFNWGFQSQFFAAQSLPLLALFLLWRSQQSQVLFPLACLVGIASAGTMANGVLALPCLLLLAIVLRLGMVRIVTLALLTALTLFAYFHGYHSISGHGSLSAELNSQPANLLRYVLLYLGSPVFHLGGGPQLAKYAGLLICLSSLGFALLAAKEWRQRPLTLCLVIYLGYLGATALGTAGGRLNFGLEQALSSRYTTPALMAWCALLVLFAQRWQGLLRRSALAQLTVLLFLLIFLPAQWHAFRAGSTEPQAKMLAALSLEMEVQDNDVIQHIYPSYKKVAALSEDARRLNKSIFANDAIRDIEQSIGHPMDAHGTGTCLGSIDRLVEINGTPEYRRIDGWLFSPDAGRSPRKIWIVDAQGLVAGYALAGWPRPDVAKLIDRRGMDSGFTGYLKASASSGPLRLLGESPNCTFQPQN
ncbi:hypothetical protein [Pseudomonas citronellolis]|uniref:hypothetical protein n=1 Tax=Pseudomonas citronellolis TaxID=53408 RepID=UPI0021C06F07|nr:hypothetical protein [Pseudomonas citronellolis]UXJ53042.1 hypothetical protein N5P21_02160 [Pseudomonas citronellolis]